MYVKTIEVPHTVVSVTTDENYKYYWIRNFGEQFVGVFKSTPEGGLAGPYANVGPGESVKVIPEETALYFASISVDEGTTNKIEIYGTNTADCPFKNVKGKGGDSGGDNTHYKGTTTTPLENGSTTNPIVIDGESYTAVFGDVVVYGYTEFVFDGTTWSEFGRPFDTVPTQGSTNAVTSDGVYRNTAGRKYYVNGVLKGEVFNDSSNVASGDNSHAEGFGTKATTYYSHSEGCGSIASGKQSHSEGHYATASGPQSHAEGEYTVAKEFGSHAGGVHTIANKPASTAIGKYNVADTDVEHLLIVGNGTAENARSNILEVSYTDMNVNGDIKVNNVAIPTPYTTMPTITESMLGKIAMYVGATGGGFIQGCFYVAATDGAAEPTYSWVQIGGGKTETVLWEYDPNTMQPGQNITLSDKFSNYDEIYFDPYYKVSSVVQPTTRAGGSTYLSALFADASDTNRQYLSVNGVAQGTPEFCDFYYDGNVTLYAGAAQALWVGKIIGIKYGSGGGSGQYSGTYTPEGAVAVTPTTGTVTGVSANGTLPAVTYDTANEELTFTAGTLPTLDTDKSFVTGATATFTGTQATITVQ